MSIIVNIKTLPHHNELDLPQYQSDQSAGMDLRAAIENDIIIQSGKWELIKTGIAIALPSGYEAQVRPRSGLALKHGITVLNSPGTIDADYRGEICVILINMGGEDFIILRGMRIAQLAINKIEQAKWNIADDLEESDRGESGFGSTGA